MGRGLKSTLAQIAVGNVCDVFVCLCGSTVVRYMYLNRIAIVSGTELN